MRHMGLRAAFQRVNPLVGSRRPSCRHVSAGSPHATRARALRGNRCHRPRPAAVQDAVADFYRGKQVSVLVGSSAGGSASLYAQALARHMGRHLPGTPGLVVQHMPGAGGLLLATTVANTAARDGAAFAITLAHDGDRAAARQQERQIRRTAASLQRKKPSCPKSSLLRRLTPGQLLRVFRAEKALGDG